MPSRICVIDLGAGNLRSVHKAVERAAHDTGLDADVTITACADDVRDADRIVLPGVGAFAACMDGLNALPGMRDALEEAVFQRKIPLLGICVGMQMMADRGLEFAVTPGLGWIKGEVAPLQSSLRTDHGLRVPHMAWSQVKANGKQELFEGRNNDFASLSGTDFYFLHSYHFVADDPEAIIATCDYGAPLVAAIARDNIVGVQFHPEKSQRAGLTFLQNFLTWQPDVQPRADLSRGDL